MTQDYDAIVVGARCAGAPTAMLLARKGYRVLVVDRASFPSDTLSTHLIHAPGVAALRRGACSTRCVATGCPPIEHVLVRLRAVHDQRHAAAAATASPRRTRRGEPCSTRSSSTPPTDAGAEVRERFTVDEVVVEDGVGRRHPGPRARADERWSSGPGS